MRKWMLACAVVTAASFWAETASAQEPIQAPTQVVAPTQTVTIAPRTGLFGRMRARRQVIVVSEPVVPTMPMANMPMQPAQGAKAPSTVQQAGYPPIQGGTPQAPATMPAATTTMPATVMTPEYYVAPRMGLFARLRTRRGM
jgi:hypothetical protein